MAPKKRNKTRSVTVRLDTETATELENIVKKQSILTISKVVRLAIDHYILEFSQGRI